MPVPMAAAAGSVAPSGRGKGSMAAGGLTFDPPASARLGFAERRVTTPTALKVGAVLLVVTSLALAVVGVRAVQLRRAAVDGITSEATPLLTGAGDLYVALADADAAASTAFLRAGQESVDLRNRYLADVDLAARQ